MTPEQIDQLEKITKLKESGTLTEEQFEKEKSLILSGKQFKRAKKPSGCMGCLTLVLIIFAIGLIGSLFNSGKNPHNSTKEVLSAKKQESEIVEKDETKTELDLLVEESSKYVDKRVFNTFPPNTNDNKAKILRIYANKLLQENSACSKLNNECKLRNEKALRILNRCLDLKAPSSGRCHCSLEVVHSNLGNKKEASASQKLCKKYLE